VYNIVMLHTFTVTLRDNEHTA